jgi:hypothetical protein
VVVEGLLCFCRTDALLHAHCKSERVPMPWSLPQALTSRGINIIDYSVTLLHKNLAFVLSHLSAEILSLAPLLRLSTELALFAERRYVHVLISSHFV